MNIEILVKRAPSTRNKPLSAISNSSNRIVYIYKFNSLFGILLSHAAHSQCGNKL